MSKKQTTAFILGAAIISSISLPAIAQTYTPQYNSGKSYGSNYGTQNYNQNTYKAPTSYQTNYQQGYQQPAQGVYMPPLQGRVVVVPAGSSLSTMTTRPISTEFNTIGDSVSVVLASPFVYNGVVIAPENSIVNGNIVISEKAGFAGKSGKLKISFTNITTPAGQRIPISGKILTNDGTGLLVGGTTKDRAVKAVKNTAIGAMGGALAGTVFGPLSGGKVGRGAALGTAVGSGLGFGKSVIDKGNNVIIDGNNPVDIVIDQPVTVNPTSSY
jgi:hypothetical protein